MRVEFVTNWTAAGSSTQLRSVPVDFVPGNWPKIQE